MTVRGKDALIQEKMTLDHLVEFDFKHSIKDVGIFEKTTGKVYWSLLLMCCLQKFRN